MVIRFIIIIPRGHLSRGGGGKPHQRAVAAFLGMGGVDFLPVLLYRLRRFKL
jgi:hypothetical protein